MKMCRWACGHTLCDRVRNDNDIRERPTVENITENCKKARLRWVGHVKRRCQYSGNGTIWLKKKRKTKAEMDGLCHESYRDNKG